MAAPPLRTALSDTYPNPSNATFRTGIGALWDYCTGLLGATGNPKEARNAMKIGVKGASVASATSPNIWADDGDVLHITGTTSITGFSAAPQAGAAKQLVFDGALTLTYGANFVVQGGANYVTSAGDRALVYAETTSKFHLAIIPASGKPIQMGTNAATAGAISGFTYANNVTDAANDIDIAAGNCVDATNAYFMTGAALTKQLDVAWAAGNNAGMLDTGTVGTTQDYFLFVIGNPTTGAVDYLASLSSSAPGMPSGYTYKRLIGWIKRVSSSNVAFTTYEEAGGGLALAWKAPTLDVDLANTLTTSRRTDTIKVPIAFSVLADIHVEAMDASSSNGVWIACPDTTDAAPSTTAAPLGSFWVPANTSAVSAIRVRTSSTGTIAARSTLATVDNYRVATIGFTWSRR